MKQKFLLVYLIIIGLLLLITMFIILVIFRDPRGFAVKFYTEEGIWDLVGNNTPIFFIKDPLFFPSFIHTQKRNPATHLKVRLNLQLFTKRSIIV